MIEDEAQCRLRSPPPPKKKGLGRGGWAEHGNIQSFFGYGLTIYKQSDVYSKFILKVIFPLTVPFVGTNL